MTRRASAAAFACHAAAVLWLTWPLAAHIATDLPKTAPVCGFDDLYIGWVLAHGSHALATAPASFPHGNIYYPATHARFYGPLGIGALPYFAPVFWLSGNPTLALNWTLLVSVALTAWALHVVVVRWTGSHLAGLLAGWAFLTARWTLWDWLPTGPSYAVLQYFPFIILLSAHTRLGVRRAALLTILVALQCLTNLVYVAPAVLGPLAFLALVRLARARTRGAGLQLLLVLGIALLAIAPEALGYIGVSQRNPMLAAQSFWPLPDPQYVAPLSWWFVGPSEWAADAPPSVAPIALLFAAVGGLGHLLSLRRREPRREGAGWRHAALWAGLGTLMSFPLAVSVFGHRIPLAQSLLLQWIPVYGHLRVPARLGVAALIGVSLLVGLGFAECAHRLRARRGVSAQRVAPAALALAMGIAMYAQYAVGAGIPAALRRAPLPAAYPLQRAIDDSDPMLETLRRSTGPLLELPAGTDPGPRVSDLARAKLAASPRTHTQAMYRSIYHWRPLLNGYGSYWPHGFLERMVLANRLPDANALAALQRLSGLEQVLVHTAQLEPARRARWIALADAGGDDQLRLVARHGGDLLFSVGVPAGR